MDTADYRIVVFLNVLNILSKLILKFIIFNLNSLFVSCMFNIHGVIAFWAILWKDKQIMKITLNIFLLYSLLFGI